MPTWVRSQGLLVAGIGIAIIGCGEDVRPSDLNTAGPPRVLAVTVRNAESDVPTFCGAREGDHGAEKLPVACLAALEGLEEGQALPPATDAAPFGWELRLVFNELLEADTVETISGGHGTLMETQPVVVECRQDVTQEFQPVTYDGYYDPSGNHLTNPPGPSVVVHLPTNPDTGNPRLDAFVATSSECQVEVQASVEAKDGEAVLASARGPFSFGIAPLAVVATEPPDEAEGVGIDQQVRVKFNAPIDGATLTGADGDRILLVPAAGEPVVVTMSLPEDDIDTPQREDDPTTVVIAPDAALAPDTSYTIAVRSDIADIKGGKLVVDGAVRDIATFRTAAAMLPDAGPDAGVDAATPDAAL